MDGNKTNDFQEVVEEAKSEIPQETIQSIGTMEKVLGFLNKLTNKQKLIGAIVILVVYTLVVGIISANIQKQIIANQIQKSFEEAFFTGDDKSSNDIKNNTKKEEQEPEKIEKTLDLNQTVTIGDVMELTLESSEWLDEIKPSNTSGVYSYYEDKDGEKYFVIRGKAKNIAGEDLDIQYANESQIVINNTYKANVTVEAEETDGSSFYGNIKPLQTLNIIAYASISDEAYNICEDIKLTLNMLSDSTYIRNFYDEDNPHETYSIEFKNTNNEE